ncbi:trypsin-like peptidase domain-containing protein [Streptomyces sp. CA-135486]|uniref:trypsin-like peptidase domain-containing protein n=1 Tax=Streptomyces sp. CA-135486 TaxID=3240049 RepID=UPI003D8EB0E0
MRLSGARRMAADLRGGAAPLILVTAGVFAGLAPVIGLDTWVSPAAAVIAVLSGTNVLRADVVAPMGARAVSRAVRPLLSGPANGAPRGMANALQIGKGVWVAPAHVTHEGAAYRVKLPDGGTLELSPAYRSAEHDIAVFHSSDVWPWVAKPQWDMPEPGDRATLVGWLVGGAVSTVQASLDLTVQESQEAGLVTMLGPAPPPGSSGSAVIAARTGRAVGILTGVGALDRRRDVPDAGSTGIVLGVRLAVVPDRFRSPAGS